jgi:hypothetical protein
MEIFGFLECRAPHNEREGRATLPASYTRSHGVATQEAGQSGLSAKFAALA